jgi:hypothetical protein
MARTTATGHLSAGRGAAATAVVVEASRAAPTARFGAARRTSNGPLASRLSGHVEAQRRTDRFRWRLQRRARCRGLHGPTSLHGGSGHLRPTQNGPIRSTSGTPGALPEAHAVTVRSPSDPENYASGTRIESSATPVQPSWLEARARGRRRADESKAVEFGDPDGSCILHGQRSRLDRGNED